jgi:hypothetical protein
MHQQHNKRPGGIPMQKLHRSTKFELSQNSVSSPELTSDWQTLPRNQKLPATPNEDCYPKTNPNFQSNPKTNLRKDSGTFTPEKLSTQKSAQKTGIHCPPDLNANYRSCSSNKLKKSSESYIPTEKILFPEQSDFLYQIPGLSPTKGSGTPSKGLTTLEIYQNWTTPEKLLSTEVVEVKEPTYDWDISPRPVQGSLDGPMTIPTESSKIAPGSSRLNLVKSKTSFSEFPERKSSRTGTDDFSERYRTYTSSAAGELSDVEIQAKSEQFLTFARASEKKA